MLVWRLCYNHSVKQGGNRASKIVGTSFALALQRLKSPCGAARELHSVASGDLRPQGFARLLVAAAGRNKKGSAKGQGKREFHGSQTAEYKSGPGTKKWRYDNILSKPAPKPAEGQAVDKKRRFYVATETLKDAHEGAVFQLSESETKHALRVLRMQEGDMLKLLDGKGLLIDAQLRGLTFSNQAFVVATSNVQQVEWEGPRWEIVVALGGLRGGRAETLVEKVTELGAWSLRPLLTNRSRTIGKFEEKDTVKIVSVEELSDVSEFEEENDFVATGRIGRWERVAMAACKQSLRVHTLAMRPPCLLKGLIPLIQSGSPAFVATQGAPPYLCVLEQHMAQVMAPGPSGRPLPCLLLVGPEGDFTEEEMGALLAAGAHPVGLGGNRLRVETATMSMVDVAVQQYNALSHKDELGVEEPIAA